ncbi:AI-2E family transporter [Cognatishimia sp. SS12]|uniref:AI-2E family transporter n=1 Tax=Cognatishimia sp. SS12 TaxID=2979465 RepID=UPI00232E97A9|nr:AI-2E family transporter [Cognatishimia sp. SS12]MDC0737849.1 AI-2E family transporter [Cognatishimia sp. SS12]
MPGFFATALRTSGVRVMVLILTIIAITTALNLAQQILAPMCFGLVLGVVVSPLADRLERLGIPRLAVALFLLIFSTLIIATIMLLIEPLVNVLISELPRIKAVMQSLIDRAASLLRGIEAISQELEETVGGNGAGEDAGKETALPTVSDALWLAPSFVSQVFTFIGTLFFFTLTRNQLYQQAGAYEHRLKRADKIVSRYFAAITLVNACLGTVTALAMMALGVEYAILWGLAAGLMNYVLYLGPLLIAVGLALAGMLQFSGVYAVLPPITFLLINLTEANVVTPLFVGRHMAMNPLLIFLAIVFGLWLWGPLGAFVALPLLLWLGVLMEPMPDAAVTDPREAARRVM